LALGELFGAVLNEEFGQFSSTLGLHRLAHFLLDSPVLFWVGVCGDVAVLVEKILVAASSQFVLAQASLVQVAAVVEKIGEKHL